MNISNNKDILEAINNLEKKITKTNNEVIEAF